jgi:8-oxo-dGTP pyrophosphatase MutT (NUDIX family)
MDKTTTTPEPRLAGRVLVIDRAGRVLLLQGFDPAEPGTRYWFTIGGGLEEGEGTAQAAARELREEAGLAASAADLAGPVWQRQTEFSFDGVSFDQHEEYYVLHADAVEVCLDGMDADERDTVTAYRWWSREELAATGEQYFPAELPELLPGGSLSAAAAREPAVLAPPAGPDGRARPRTVVSGAPSGQP